MSEDSLVATRARRANAGSRLKKLIELEEQTIEERSSIIYTEEDENVNLLFQEDENDEEFEESEEEDSDGDDDGEDDGQGGDEDGNENENDDEEESLEETTKRKRNHEEVAGDDDLSDSELSVTDSDESEGEKELHRQEKLKKRKVKKQLALIPTIRQPKPIKSADTKKKPKIEFTANSLMNAKRASSRSAAVENKQALAKRLRADEERRALLKPVVRPKFIELTQEERLAEAVETEKANIISLQRFREQEVVKKEHQRQMLMLKRKKLTDLIRFVSKDTVVTPTEEIKEARRLYEIALAKSKKKPGRKKKMEVDPPQLKMPGEVDKELPAVKIEIERLRLEKQKEREKEEQEKRENDIEIDNENNEAVEEQKEEKNNEEENNEENKEEESKNEEMKDVEMKDENNEVMKSESVTIEESGNEASKKDGGDSPEQENQEIHEKIDEVDTSEKEAKKDLEESSEKLEGSEEPNNQHDDQKDIDIENESASVDNEVNDLTSGKVEDTSNSVEPVVKVEQEKKSEETVVKTEGIEGEISKPSEEDETKLKESTTETTKKVKFADEISPEAGEDLNETKDDDSKEPSIEILFKQEEEIFEGPAQRVCRNTIGLLDFDEESGYKLVESNIKSILFGSQSLIPASHRFKDLKTIAKIGEVENPYSTVVQKKDKLFEPVAELTEEDALFEELKRLPRFGDFEDIVEEEENNQEEVTAEIVLKTEAPTSLYLPNGNKKNCLITGTEVKYFDPANGIPYSSVETYRLLKQIEQGNIPWYSMGTDMNDNGPVELYLGNREEGGVRHAKGVPEGFGG